MRTHIELGKSVSLMLAYRALWQGYTRGLAKARDVQITPAGVLDVVDAPVTAGQGTFPLRVRAEESDGSYGTLADLERLYSGGGTVWLRVPDREEPLEAVLIGEFSPSPLTPMLGGANAYFVVALRLMWVEP